VSFEDVNNKELVRGVVIPAEGRECLTENETLEFQRIYIPSSATRISRR
jgi:hypothetical protein